MNKAKEYECEQCRKKISDDNLINLPCGYLICFEHVSSNEETFKCHFCPLHFFTIKEISEMQKNRLKLNQMKLKLKIDDLKERKNFLQMVQKDPKSFLSDTFSNALKAIDARKEALVEEFNKKILEIHEDLVKKVKEREKWCLNELKYSLKDYEFNRLLIDKDSNNNISFEYKENFLNRIQDKEYEPMTEQELIDKHNEVNFMLSDFKLYKFESYKKSIYMHELFGKVPDIPYHRKEKHFETIEFKKSFNSHDNDVFLIRKVDNDKFVSCSRDSAKLWQKSTGKCLKTFKDNSIFVSLNVVNDELICYFTDGTVVAKSLNTGLEKRLLNAQFSSKFLIECIEIVDEMEYFSGHADGGIIHWQNFINKKKLMKHSGPIMKLKYIEKERLLVSASKNGTMKLLNVETGETNWVVKISGEVKCLDFSNSNIIVSQNNSLKIYDLKLGECKRAFSKHEKIITGLTRLKYKDWLSCSTDGSVHLFDMKRTEVIYKADGCRFTTILCFDENEILLADSKSIKLWIV